MITPQGTRALRPKGEPTMKNTNENRQLLNRLSQLCEGTPYTLETGTYEETGNLYADLRTRFPADRFTPEMRLDERRGCFKIGVQTTAYGTQSAENILEIASDLTIAANLAKALRLEIENAGYQVEGA